LQLTLASRLRECREARGLTQRQLARLTGLSDAYVSMIERGARDNIGKVTLRALASVLETTLEWLELGEGPRDPQTIARFEDGFELALPGVVLSNPLATVPDLEPRLVHAREHADERTRELIADLIDATAEPIKARAESWRAQQQIDQHVREEIERAKHLLGRRAPGPIPRVRRAEPDSPAPVPADPILRDQKSTPPVAAPSRKPRKSR